MRWLLITPSIAYLIKSGISIGIPNLIIPTIIVAKIRYLYGLTNCKYRLIIESPLIYCPILFISIKMNRGWIHNLRCKFLNHIFLKLRYLNLCHIHLIKYVVLFVCYILFNLIYGYCVPTRQQKLSYFFTSLSQYK